MFSVVAHRYGGHGAELGHAVTAQDVGPSQYVSEPAQGTRRDRRAADGDDGEAGEVGLPKPW